MTRSLFVTFEGGEGAGKTTLIQQIVHELSSRNLPLVTTREPGGTPLGEEVRRLLLEPSTLSPYAELSLFLASRAQHIAQVIRPALAQHKIVLCDRFNDSTIAYQGAARGLGVEKVSEFCAFISQNLEPDLTFYLDLDPHVGLTRIEQRSKDRIEAETLSFHIAIRKAFHDLANRYPRRLRLLDASKSPSEVFRNAMEILDEMLG
ncbi:MAG TPA: dTMP kinase [Parachlamydiales bacterium]|nr:dTMP kinase [Parachlamydiales bacterium]